MKIAHMETDLVITEIFNNINRSNYQRNNNPSNNTNNDLNYQTKSKQHLGQTSHIRSCISDLSFKSIHQKYVQSEQSRKTSSVSHPLETQKLSFRILLNIGIDINIIKSNASDCNIVIYIDEKIEIQSITA